MVVVVVVHTIAFRTVTPRRIKILYRHSMENDASVFRVSKLGSGGH